MEIFIDTNIFLEFYSRSNADLDQLGNIFSSNEDGDVEVYITEHLKDEFLRNRDTKIQQALKEFDNESVPGMIPTFMRGYPGFDIVRKMAEGLKKGRAELRSAALKDAKEGTLQADSLIQRMFNNSKPLPTSDQIYEKARRRVALGNPPGKKRSLGDAINWEVLLANVPVKSELTIVSQDGDFFSALEKSSPHSFLKEEWKREKEGDIRVYGCLSDFVMENFKGVKIERDPEKKTFLDELLECELYFETHRVVAYLLRYNHFTKAEARQILEAAVNNSQVGDIVGDIDLSSLILRAAQPYPQLLSDPRYEDIFAEIRDRG